MEEKAKTLKYKVSYRNIKYPRLEYKTGTLTLILPKDYKDETTLIQKHKEWINKKEEIINKALEEAKEKNLNLTRTKEELKTLTYTIVKKYREEFKFKVNKIFFRRMKTKWASYSPKGNLTINTLLKHLPEKLIEYVIFHELTHSLEKRHNERFFKIISKKFGDYQRKEKDLLIYWFLLHQL